MAAYLIKSGALITIFLLVYKWVLEPTPMPRFNRFYLLFSLLASLIIPLIVFTSVSYIDVQETAQLMLNDLNVSEPETALIGQSLIQICLWTIYSMGFGLFFLKFTLNLYQIIREITLNPKKRQGNFINVLLDKEVSPHTFFNYIFFNKYSFEAGIIPDEVFWHEETHARQYHSIDILIVEFIQVIFWFNPLIYFTKKAIKLNHEYLADQAVLAKGVPMRNYLQTLLTFAQFKDPLALTHSIQQSPIKKRFALMKTIKNKRTMMYKSFLVLPLFSILLYGFSQKETLEVQKKISSPIQNSQANISSTDPHVNAINSYNAFYASYEKQRTASPHFIHRSKKDQAELLALNSTLGGMYFKLTDEAKNQVDRPIHPATPYVSLVIDGKKIYKLKSELTTAEYQQLSLPPSAETQDKATPAQVARYNKLAKKYRAMIKSDKIIVKEAELTEMRKIFALMTTDQKKNAEAFPQLPPPPPPPPAPPVIKKGGNNPQNIPPPPPPPTPPNPLDHIIKLAKKGASFYYEGKKVSSDVLIDKLKKNENLQIQVREENTKNPKVYVKKVSQLKGSNPAVEEVIEIEEVAIEVIEEVEAVEFEVMEVIEEVEEVEEPLMQEVIEVIEEEEVDPKEVVEEVVEEVIEEEIIVELPSFLNKLKKSPQDKTGYKTINKEIIYFITNKNGTRYFNRFGKEVDSNRKLK